MAADITIETRDKMDALNERLNRLESTMDEKFRGIESTVARTMEDSMNKMRELLVVSRESGPSGDHSVNRTQGQRGERLEPLVAATNQHRPQRIKLELPRFNGGDPSEWVCKVKQIITYQEIPDDQQVSFAAFHLTEEANEWWLATAKKLRIHPLHTTWEIFEEELWIRFGPTEGENFHMALSKIRQTGSLRDYQREFERLQNKVDNWSEDALVGTFLGGLNETIANHVLMFAPTTLKEVIRLSRRSEELLRQKRSFQPRTYSQATTAVVRAAASQQMSSGGESNRASVSPTPKKLSWEEMKRKRSLGLCFSCDERYSPGHRCKKSQLLLMEGDDVDDDDDDDFVDSHEVVEPEISLQSLTGWGSPKTLRVRIEIQRRHLVALIDSGATHNFIDEHTAGRLGLKLTKTTPFNVRVADGHPLRCRGAYRRVCMMLAGEEFEIDFYGLPLSGLDVVLGVSWLEKLGPVVCDWKAQTMTFDWAQRNITIHGLQRAKIGEVKSEEIEREAKRGHSIFALTIQHHNHDEVDVGESPTTAPEGIRRLLVQFESVFQPPTTLPPRRDIEHHIALKEGSDPVNVRPYRYAHFQKEEIERQVQAMLDAGLIRPSSSPFSSPVLLVKKKDGSWRFCTDYRALNAATVKDRFPIPTVEDMLDELHGAVIFTKLDLTAGYHQVRVHEPDISKTAFRTHNGHYEYLVMPFGLCNAPSTFQALMNSIFRGLLRKFVLVFFDDILVYSRSEAEHLRHVQTVLEILHNNRLFVKRKKCDFGKREVEYLGHIISAAGVQVDQNKIRAMVEWPAPTTITELRGFLGLTGYYRKFVQNYGLHARPLTNLLKKGKFEWSAVAEAAFVSLKTAMTTTPTLALPDFTMPFIIQTDASGDGIGAVLTQNGRPIAFLSRSLGVAKQNWSTYAREMLAIVVAVRTWRPYLLGRRFTIQTDQKSLRFLLEQRILTPEQQKWVGKLDGYDYEITYKPGATNKVADALSRRSQSPCLNTICSQQAVLWEKLRQLQDVEPYLVRVGKLAAAAPGQPYAIRNGLVCFKNRVVIPPHSPLMQSLLCEYHDTPVGGHSGVLRTFKRLAQAFYWPAMHKTVREYVAACDTCQRAKSASLSPAGLLQPLSIPHRVWEDLSMDFIDGLPCSDKHTTIMVVVDRLTKAAHLVPLSHPYTAKSVAAKFVEFVVKLHGIPKTIVSDRDPVFVSAFWKDLWRLSGTKLCMTSAYHPQSDGQTEVVNRCIEQFLRCFVHNRPHQWCSMLPWAEFWYNTTFHSSIGMTPFKAMYGREPPLLAGYESGSTPIQELDAQLVERDALLGDLKKHLEAAANRMKQVADAKRRDVTFAVGDWVFLRLQPYRQHSIFRRTSQKLSTRYYGPFQIEARVGPVAYRLKLPEGTKVHSVFHVSLLKQRVGTDTPTSGILPPLRTNGLLRLRPEQVLDVRTVVKDGNRVQEVLVLWHGLSEVDATWEDKDQLVRSFPTLNLEDKLHVDGGSNDGVAEPVRRASNRTRIPNRKYVG